MSQKEKKIKPAQPDYLFEVSWEVCNKVGGIYTVLVSKANQMANFFGRNYYLIGPYFPEKIKGYFQEKKPSLEFSSIFEELEKKRIKCYSGRWLIKGQPRVILIDFKNLWSKINEIKTKLWEDYKIDSLGTGHDFEEPVLWAWAVGLFIESLSNNSHFQRKKIIVHFHEWLSGAGLLYIKKTNVKIGTVFTTHATSLGRSLAWHNINFYFNLTQLNPEEESSKCYIKAKHQLEKNVAQNCDIFTTPSEITAFEAEHFLGRKSDFLLPNGLNSEGFLNLEEIVIKHQVQRERLKEFLLFYFFPYYSFDLENVLFYFIVGRYEFRAKGIDIFIKALAKLNQKLIKDKNKKTIVVFFWIPAAVKEIKAELLENKELLKDIKDSLEEVYEEVKIKILHALIEGKKISEKNLFKEDFLFELKKKLIKFKKEGLPSLVTHNLENFQDPILNSLKEVGLDNKKRDKVKIVFYPIYLTGHDGLTNLNYQEGIEACHLGVFPSFYEPWGYTPLETAALGVASVTTDLSGFGRFCQKLTDANKQPGIFVLKRFNRKDEEVIEDLSNFLFYFSQFSRKERIENKIQARKIAAKTEWKVFIKNYLKAYVETIRRVYGG